jgi:hypothetical protein
MVLTCDMNGGPEGGRLADPQVLEAGRPGLRTNPGCRSDAVPYAQTVKTAWRPPLQLTQGLAAARNSLFIIRSGPTA